ncbi:MATE efflux family protein [Gleimia coleocanis DSM 15436]|uniref:MATE efflux family protein n=1 Tax=Gleimia coleocanis DSM 15436 TaxID=525245 RepID=C0VXX8_9ACTO|nr:MATE family efflux transporter [Gleimia coleocanis]EEH64281.1 MATE efflux family protein [Gleimia coleocanis DSM 15436]
MRAKNIHHDILNLAIPALATLIAHPLFTTIDAAMVGHLGTHPLAGLSIGSTILTTLFGLFIFLAYSTTSITAKHFGAGNTKSGLKAGVDALWLAILIGVIATLFLLLTATTLIRWMGTSPETYPHAHAYLTYATPGLIGMLLSLASTGTLRGLLDTRTPLLVASFGAVFNTAVNYLLIFVFQFGVAGSAIGTSLTELMMGIVLATKIITTAHAAQISFLPDFSGIFTASLTGAPLIIRTLAMRVCLFFTVVTLTQAGDFAVAGNQIVTTVWNFTAFALDALAIAAQALVGRSLGANNLANTRSLLQILAHWGWAAGTLLGILVATFAPLIPLIFTSETALASITTAGLWASAPFYLLAGYVFVLDGILIGAGDNRYLAVASTAVMTIYLPALLVFDRAYVGGGPLTTEFQQTALVIIWILFGIFFMGGRAFSLFWRARQDTWMHT